MHVFFIPDIDSNDLVILDEDESKHCIKVLRLGKGDHIHLIDGIGGFYTAEITEGDQKKCNLQILDKITEYGKRNFYVHIAIAPTKSMERFEWFLEKATEIGIDEITPVICENSERKTIRKERLERIIISAMKQSLKAYKPVLNDLSEFKDFIEKNINGQKYIAHCHEGIKSHLKTVYSPGEDAVILIGPEGDFFLREVTMAKTRGFKEISLGNSRLRTETAGVIACHTISLLNE